MGFAFTLNGDIVTPEKTNEAIEEYPAYQKKKWEKEQKPADKVEPKFKIGDWVVSPNGVYWHIDAIQNGRYQVSSDSGTCADWPLNTNIYHKFTIQDAKDGDVLVYEEEIFMIKSYVLWHKIVYHCCYDEKELHIHSIYESLKKEDFENVHPATKEQRDTLFAKMKESGYEWDAEKKELKKIEQNDIIEIPFGVRDSELQEVTYHIPEGFHAEIEGNRVVIKKGEYKPAWSEEDEDTLKAIIKEIEANKAECPEYDEKVYDMFLSWLKSIKERMKGE
jgi:hypothetical protein